MKGKIIVDFDKFGTGSYEETNKTINEIIEIVFGKGHNIVNNPPRYDFVDTSKFPISKNDYSPDLLNDLLCNVWNANDAISNLKINPLPKDRIGEILECKRDSFSKLRKVLLVYYSQIKLRLPELTLPFENDIYNVTCTKGYDDLLEQVNECFCNNSKFDLDYLKEYLSSKIEYILQTYGLLLQGFKLRHQNDVNHPFFDNDDLFLCCCFLRCFLFCKTILREYTKTNFSQELLYFINPVPRIEEEGIKDIEIDSFIENSIQILNHYTGPNKYYLNSIINNLKNARSKRSFNEIYVDILQSIYSTQSLPEAAHQSVEPQIKGNKRKERIIIDYIDEETLLSYFVIKHNSAVYNPKGFIAELKKHKLYVKDVGRIALYLKDSGYLKNKYKNMTFADWLRIFCKALGVFCPKDTNPRTYKTKKEPKDDPLLSKFWCHL